MRCGKFRDWINRSVDDDLEPDQAHSLEAHLADCEACRVYRADLMTGRRMLRATEPELSDNFDWKLQLRMNRTLAEAAGNASMPWKEERPGRWSWLRNLGLAGGVGLAAVLALGILMGGHEGLLNPGGGATSTIADAQGEGSPNALDRRSIVGGWTAPAFGQRLVGTSTQPALSGGMAAGERRLSRWSGDNLDDLRLITNLRQDNEFLRKRLHVMLMRNAALQEQLDTAGIDPEN